MPGLFSRSKPSGSRTPNDGERDRNTAETEKNKSAKGSNNPFADAAAEDAPPAYSQEAPAAAKVSSLRLEKITNPDTPYAFLEYFDTVFVIDDSGSMVAGTRWSDVQKVLRYIAPICTEYDKDGIDVYFLNHRNRQALGPRTDNKAKGGYYHIHDDAAVNRIFKEAFPQGGTPTGTRLNDILEPYVWSLEEAKQTGKHVKPVNIIVITDGEATVDPEETIITYARKLDQLNAPPHQVGIQFFQVGDSSQAKEWLRELDDQLKKHGIRDMVDTVTWGGFRARYFKTLSADVILKTVLGGVVRRLDRKRV
ncbi:hypothetical protein CCMA1212_003035 [Trichoderma ghanense]|uniref:VWFA domain-containing protein n=1 Tax=Trichoderma ghanense TaxID=65468 RepID=A0ABY2HA34_9HYPO